MSASLRTTLALAGLIAIVPTAGIASAKGDDRSDDGPKRPCAMKGGKGYEAKGALAEGSVLEQVAGADTANRRDDRYSGTLVVNVKKGNKRGRADKGLTSFTLTAVRVKGLVDGALPAVGTRVDLNGKMPRNCPVEPTTPSTTPDEVASSQELASTPESTTPEVVAPKASAAVLTKVEFKQLRKPRSSDDDKGKDEPKGSDDKPSDDDKGGEKR